MEFFDTLASFGITTKVLQIAIFTAIIVVVLALYWKLIAIGAGILFTVVVFAMPSKAPTEVKTIDVQNVQPVIIEDPKLEPEANLGKKEFMFDCQRYGGEPKSVCESMWNDRENGIEPVKGKKWNRSYMKKV